jgi:hypothetical protein
MYRILSNVLRWLSAVVLCGIALWLLNLVVYHMWAADRFLSGTQEVSDWHLKWALIFLAAALILFVGASAMVWGLVFRRRSATS